MNEPHLKRVIERSRFKRTAWMLFEAFCLTLMFLAFATLLAVLGSLR